MKRVIERTKPKQKILESIVVAHFREFPEDEKAIISITRDKMTRSGKQNKMYWAWLGVLSECGHTDKELHTLMKKEHLGYKTTVIGDTEVIELRSTTDLKVGEMKEYLDKIDKFAAELGIILPREEHLYYESMGIKR
jgi:hypothetical protein